MKNKSKQTSREQKINNIKKLLLQLARQKEGNKSLKKDLQNLNREYEEADHKKEEKETESIISEINNI